ncbi:NADH dehydrogenase [ubiquinone] iron-sulfur protein 5 isoform X1 [Sander lucioperca]|uniref:NADH dehydrogenase [ubiquinone] iron-sulfur protein 5 isoform X1 n=1 Tax=Sander lucioperca TaxID=283035 RepID=UPI00125D24DD|nr:NADH dehydrogenase [ubiquinone] iron-sulfur protein 5 isoform X1 [Sander lucioperca]
MPFVDLQSRLGINLDSWLLLQSGHQPNKRAARCHAFEKEWIECAHDIGQTRAKKECQLEFEDFYECMHRQKTSRDRQMHCPLTVNVLQQQELPRLDLLSSHVSFFQNMMEMKC